MGIRWVRHGQAPGARPSALLLREHGQWTWLQGRGAREPFLVVPGKLAYHLDRIFSPDLQMGCHELPPHGITMSMKLNHRKRGSGAGHQASDGECPLSPRAGVRQLGHLFSPPLQLLPELAKVTQEFSCGIHALRTSILESILLKTRGSGPG